MDRGIRARSACFTSLTPGATWPGWRPSTTSTCCWSTPPAGCWRTRASSRCWPTPRAMSRSSSADLRRAAARCWCPSRGSSTTGARWSSARGSPAVATRHYRLSRGDRRRRTAATPARLLASASPRGPAGARSGRRAVARRAESRRPGRRRRGRERGGRGAHRPLAPRRPGARPHRARHAGGGPGAAGEAGHEARRPRPGARDQTRFTWTITGLTRRRPRRRRAADARRERLLGLRGRRRARRASGLNARDLAVGLDGGGPSPRSTNRDRS